VTDKIKRIISKIRLDNLKAFIKKNPHAAFIAALALLVLVSVGFTSYAKYQQRRHIEQMKQQTQREVPSKEQVLPQNKSTGSSSSSQQMKWKGIPVLTSGPVTLSAPPETPGLHGNVVKEPLMLGCDKTKTAGKADVQASVIFPLGGKYQKMVFFLSQNYISGDIQEYAYATRLQIFKDNNPAYSRVISKDSLLSQEIPVSLDIAGANQVTVKIETEGRKYKKDPNDSSYEVTDQYGPFFTINMGGLSFE